ncbi:hypothetical protein SAMD00019534_107270 [Acytostelium subglobosum LB1]|uniref:hypothetical protein n=1 Tax=Acytostelium subglobosum LB1 TaxID=1410327 RepID=UPI0006451058|nr:hypothetical protein SAMD00019534_107270 [Acytostelium subglobosum LB1]GAM27551.1 hypothetical protein SAMD00019534_107270 [Acytostelium subglobosum LB1]|eukprot:XP_012749616.1 hypothetical protein SAMD00019534_107270 [Acytostelium subglobosum LB1]
MGDCDCDHDDDDDDDDHHDDDGDDDGVHHLRDVHVDVNDPRSLCISIYRDVCWRIELELGRKAPGILLAVVALGAPEVASRGTDKLLEPAPIGLNETYRPMQGVALVIVIGDPSDQSPADKDVLLKLDGHISRPRSNDTIFMRKIDSEVELYSYD